VTREAIEASRGVIDSDAAVAAWETALEAPLWDGTPVWIHADLLRPNVLVDRGQLCAVIDFGAVGVGDGAADVIAAWSVFGQRGRAMFRAALDVDDGTWNRARGYTLHQAVLIIRTTPRPTQGLSRWRSVRLSSSSPTSDKRGVAHAPAL